MPGGDRTGPMGMGPMTGRAAGYCAGYSLPGYAHPLPGRGFGMGRGRGFGRGRWGQGRGYGRGAMYGDFYGLPGAYPPVNPSYGVPYAYPPPMTSEQETEMLKTQAEHLKGGLEDINRRLAELEAAAAKK